MYVNVSGAPRAAAGLPGYGRRRVVVRRGVGDINPAFFNTPDGPVTFYNSVASPSQVDAALANLKAAGATSGSCQTYHVSYPGTPGYDQTECTSNLDNNYHDPTLIAKMSPAQLAAEAAAARAAASSVQGGPAGSNWMPNPIGAPVSIAVPGVVKSPPTGGSSAGSGGAGSTPPGGSGPSSGGAGQKAGGGGNPPPASMSGFLSSKVSIFGFDVPVWGVGAALLGGFFLLGGKK